MYHTRWGFSLPEILLTLLLTALIAMLAVPGYESLRKKSAADLTAAELMRVVNLASSEAVTQGVTVTLCGSQDNTACGDTWQQSILFLDETAKGDITDKDIILYKFTAILTGKLHWRSSLGRPYLQWRPDGATYGENGTFWYCLPNEKIPRWAIKLNQAGRARLVSDINDLQALLCL